MASLNTASNKATSRQSHGSVFRCTTFPLPVKERDDALFTTNLEEKRQADSCVLPEQIRFKLRLEKGRNEYTLARGVKYSQEAGERRKEIALVMLLRAARNGSLLALEELSDCYRRGIGTSVDEAVATELLKAFLRRSVERRFLETLLSRAYKQDENKRDINKGKDSTTHVKHGWLCFQARAYQSTKRMSHRLFCFIDK